MVKHLKRLTGKICLSIGKEASMSILIPSNVSFPKSQPSVGFSPRDGDDVAWVSHFYLSGNTKERKRVSHLGKKKRLLERCVAEDMNKIACDHQSILGSFI